MYFFICLILCLGNYNLFSSSDEEIIQQKFIVMSNENDPHDYTTEGIVLNNEQLVIDLKNNDGGKDEKFFGGVFVHCTRKNIEQLESIMEKKDYTIKDILDGYLIADRLGLPEDCYTIKNFSSKLNIFSYEELVVHYRNH